MIQVRWDLRANAEIVIIAATDNDTAPNSMTISYELVGPLYPLPNGVSDGQGIFDVDATTGSISLMHDLISSIMYTAYVLTVRATDGGSPPRSSQHELTLIPIPVPSFGSRNVMAIDIDEERY